MFGALNKIWPLLALCGTLQAICSAMHLLMLNLEGSVGLRRFASLDTVWNMCAVALAAGTCAIIAGAWNSGRESAWLLALHGFTLGAFGLIGVSPLVKSALSFRQIAVLFVLMAVSAGAFAFRTAQGSQIGATGKWFLRASGAAFLGFAISFIAVGFNWIKLAPPNSYWIWMSSFFGLCAIFNLFLAIRGRRQGVTPIHAQPIQAAPPCSAK